MIPLTHKYIKTAATLAVLSLFFCIGALAGKPRTAEPANTFASPDFAFPQTVIEHAQKAMRSAERSGNKSDLVKAAMQIVAANRIISNDGTPKMAAWIDSLAMNNPNIYGNILYSFEAQLYVQMYENDGRHDDELYAAKVDSLVSKSLANPSILEATPLKAISTLLRNHEQIDTHYYPSMYELLTLRGIYLLSRVKGAERKVIPFTNTTGQPGTGARISTLLDSLIVSSRRRGEVGAESIAIIALSRYKSDRNAYLTENFNRLRNHAECMAIAAELSQPEILNDALSLYPASPYAPEIKNRLAELCCPRFEINAQATIMGTDSIRAKVTLGGADSVYMVLYRADDSYDTQRARSIAEQIRHAKTVGYQKLSAPLKPWQTDTVTISYAPQRYGKYFIVPTRDTGGKQPFKEYTEQRGSLTPTIHVTDLVTLAISDNEGNCEIYAGSASSLEPVSDVAVTLNSRFNKPSLNPTQSDITGNSGYAHFHLAPDCYYSVSANKGDDTASEIGVSTRASYKNRTTEYCTILTDLPLYRPGDEVKAAVIAYQEKDRRLTLLTERQLEVVVYDASFAVADTIRVTTDQMGRATFSYDVPKGKLAGTYSLQVKDLNGQASFQVDDYKAPTFMVEYDDTLAEPDAKGLINFRGRAVSYSGTPVADARVNFTISCMRNWWRANDDTAGATYGGTTNTDSSGHFVITLDTKGLEDTPYMKASYRLELQCTDRAGETLSAPTRLFALGNSLNISASLPESVNASSGDVCYKVVLTDMCGSAVKGDISYTITDAEGMVVGGGTFSSPDFKLAPGRYPSGEYTIHFKASDDNDVHTESRLTIWRESDKTPARQGVLWTPLTEIYTHTGEQETEVSVGSSYSQSTIAYTIYDCDRLIENGTIKSDGMMCRLKVPVPKLDGRTYVRFTACHNLDIQSSEVTIYHPSALDTLKVETISFRDRITPGENEHWQFRYRMNNGQTPLVAVIAALTDRAIESLIPFNYHFNPRSNIYMPRAAFFAQPSVYQSSYAGFLESLKRLPYHPPVVPTLNDYMPVVSELKFYNSALMTRATGMAADGIMIKEAAVEETDDETVSAESDTPKWREISEPLAWFKPMLKTEADGTLTIEFTAPESNTTWHLQTVGYTSQLQALVKSCDIIASRPLTVKAQFPRFVRTADNVGYAATVSNNTSVPLTADVTMEWFEPNNPANVLNKDSQIVEIQPNGSQSVSFRFAASTGTDLLGVKVTVHSGNHSDGEQTLVSVMPSAMQITESKPFYLSPEQTDACIELPGWPSDAQRTMNYCDNTIWYAVTALPALDISQSPSILARMASVFSSATAFSLIKNHGEISRAITDWQDTHSDILTSPLFKNLNLKNVSLAMTPWAQDAMAETVRMVKLVQYLDTNEAATKLKEAAVEIAKAQTEDGAWSWCEGMQPSHFVTESMLYYLSRLQAIGALPEELKETARRAIEYCDDGYIQQWKRNKKQFSYNSVADYIFIRQQFDARSNGDFAAISSECLKQCAAKWKDYDPQKAALTALILWKSGNKQTPLLILESLRQKAIIDPNKGMWFDNFSSGYQGLATSMRALEAFSTIAHGCKETDQLRQWLLTQRQAQDWSDARLISELIYQLITTGSEWASTGSEFIITDGADTLAKSANRYSGDMVVSFKSDATKINIKRSGHTPAWGAVTAQFTKQITDIKSHSTENINISKQLYRVIADADGERIEPCTDFRIGDRIRVVLDIDCKQDMDYVSVCDDRPSIIMPAEQLSGYTSSDGLWYYRQTLPEATYLFFDRLPRGSHRLTYDCYIDRQGTALSGIASAQTLYAPWLTAHSNGTIINAK